MQLALQVLSADQEVRLEASGTDEVVMVFGHAYRDGDCIAVQLESAGVHLVISLDDALPPCLVFVSSDSFVFPIPFGPDQKAYSPKAFSGDIHRMSIRRAHPVEISALRNLALNPYDHHSISTVYPHSQATTQTRGEAAFAARNAIDGEKAASGHGHWPYTSWGINSDPSAALTITFGRPVHIEQMKLYLRADFPHDAWWRQVSLTLSNGTTGVIELEKTARGQCFDLSASDVEWVQLHSLIKADDPSPFPALTQLEIWGNDLRT